MSLKLGNGFKFKSKDIFDIHDQVMRCRPLISSMQAEIEARFVISRAFDIVDAHIFKGVDEAKGKPPFVFARDELLDRQSKIKTTGLRDPAVDVGMEVSILPYKGDFYGVVFTDQRDLDKLFHQTVETAEFGYWDSTDKPDHLSEAEWSSRSDIWYSIFDQSSSARFSDLGFTLDLNPVERRAFLMRVEEALEYAPSFEERVAKLARNSVSHKWIQEKSQALKGDTYGIISGLHEYVNSKEGKVMLASFKEKISKTIPEVIGRELLLSELINRPAEGPAR